MALIPAAFLGLAGCKTPPANPLAAQQNPTLAGGLSVVATSTEKAVVVSITPDQRTVAIRSAAGATTTCKAAPQVADLGQIQPGDKVKATVTRVVAFFPVKNGPPPSAGAGVTVAGTAAAGQPAEVVLPTTDTRGKLTKVDPSYRLMTVQYADGSTKEYKIPLPATLENLQPGDEVVVRTTEPLLLRIERK